MEMNQNTYEMFKENSLNGYPTERNGRKEQIEHSLYMKKLKDLYGTILYPRLEKEEDAYELIHKIEQTLMTKETSLQKESGDKSWMK